MFEKAKKFYEDKYKLLMIIPVLILIFSAGVLLYNESTTGEYIKKDVSLKGGLFITIQTSEPINLDEVSDSLENELQTSVRIKELRGVGTGGTIGYTFEVAAGEIEDVKKAISQETGFEFEEGTYTIEETSAALSKQFWDSTIKAIIVALIFMGVVVFLYFRKIIPSTAVILAAVSDLVGTLAFINILDIKLSTAGVAALLMLIGYSVDTDILLSTKVLKRIEEGSLIERVFSAIKTGLTMQGTTLIALTVIYIITPAEILRSIALVLIIGLLLDIVNTWLQNMGLLRWYMEKKEKSEEKEKKKISLKGIFKRQRAEKKVEEIKEELKEKVESNG